jgi:PAS domain-containing protein
MRACFLLLGLVAPPLAPDDSAEVRALLNRAIQVLGGAEQLGRQPARTWKGKGTFYGQHGGKPFQIHGARQGADQITYTMDSTAPDTPYHRTLVLDRTRGWVKMNDRLQELTGEALEEELKRGYTNWVTTLLPLREADFQLSLLPAIDVDGQEAVGILVQGCGRHDVRLYFDQKTALMVKRESVIRDMQHGGKRIIEEVIFSGYRNLGGVQHATQIKVYWDGKLRYDVELTEQARKAKLANSVFAQP